MGESTCLMPTFSYAPGISNESKQGNPMHALGESVSFGRFVTESLAWEKWSTFSHNRYVEEAERYAQPGSVAQKKAFFEAHYKRIAAQKAAALLEQANAANNNAPEQEEREDTVCDHVTVPQDSHPMILDSQEIIGEQLQVEAPNVEANFIANANGHNSSVTLDELGQEREVQMENFTNNESSSNQLENAENDNLVSELELSGPRQMEKPLLELNLNSDQDVAPVMSKKKSALSSLKSSVYRRASKIPSSPAKHMASIHPQKENNVTPITVDPKIASTDKKRSTRKSLHSLINLTPARESDKASSTPGIRKIESSRVASSSLKAPNDCVTPLRTPTMAHVNGATKHNPLTTPSSASKRARTQLDPSFSQSKTTEPKWHILSAVSKSISACRNKLQSPALSSPFKLRTEERAARRKQKLEEKFNAKEAQKVQIQTKFKEKAESEIRKLRQTFCFKARPLPDFYKDKETPKNQIKKTPLTRPQSPKLGRKPSSSTMQSSLACRTPMSNTSGFKNALKKNSRIPTLSLNSQPKMIIYESTSPDIQH
ncbi:protein WVD2-like 7 isoform X2 [Cornus florida]|uniref:protein WVD2-like 7 isoform X2 n=1 Tax=Cornus florida TaxID=4283 RepID=UPI00289C1EEE|nr:protein WVD2-like 7 isoform X2 [Cornus florida]